MSGLVVWVTGLPGAGKSTFAERLRASLREPAGEQAPMGACLLDGDAVRAALVPPPRYDDSGRADFYATLVNLAVLLAEQGLVVIVPATASRAEIRAEARRRAPAFLEILVATSLEECAARDPKGLYRLARQGRIADLPGVDAPFEAPERPEVRARGGLDDEALARALALITGRAA